MKRFILIIMVLLLAVPLFSEALAQSRTHEVKKGDTLWSISRKYPQVSVDALWQANREKVPDKDMIHPGQKLQVPESAFRYKNPNMDPFTRARDPDRLIREFDCPQEVRKKFSEIAQGFLDEPSEKYQVKKGDALWKLEKKFNVPAEEIYESNRDVIDHPEKWLFPGQELTIPGASSSETSTDESDTILLSSQEDHLSFLEEMGFGDYQVVTRVQVDFQEPQKAKRWRVKGEEKDYFLVLPLNCYNWGWYQKDKSVKKEKKKKHSVIVFPRLMQGEREVPETVESSPADRYPEKKWKLNPSWESIVYAGHYKGVQRENSENWHQYAGGHLYLFPDSYVVGGGKLRVGPAAQILSWRGEADEAVEYSGDTKVLGLRVEHLREWSETTLTIAGGEKRERVEGIGFPYRSRGEADILVAELQHSWWYPRSWFRQMEVGGRAQITGNEEKSTYFLGEPVSDPAVDQGEYSVRYKTDIYGNRIATPTMEGSVGWRAFDRSAFFEPRAGIEWLQDTAATDVSYLMVEHSQNDMAAAHLRLDISKASKKIKNWLTDT